LTTFEELTPDQIRHLDTELGSTFGLGDRLFGSFADDDIVSLAWNLETRDFAEMLAEDGNARKIERVLTLPVRGAPVHIVGTGPAADLVRGNVGPILGQLVEQCCGAVAFRRAFFEKVWTTDADGRIVYDKLAWRPPASCAPRFDRKTGEQQGFQQRITDAGWWAYTQRPGEDIPGQVTIPRHKAFVYTHGRWREPVKGVSDLEVAYNAYRKKKKLKFLWAQFLENQSLPKTAVFGRDAADAQRNATELAKGRASAIIPMVRQADAAEPFAIIESSGRGAAQFVEAIRYFDWEQTNSVLAGFTELASSQQTTGSYALSADQSEFFLASEQALADEIADQIMEQVFTPLVVLNFGPDTEVPSLRIGPIGRQQTDRALALLETIVGASKPMVPLQFVGFLLNQVSEALGLDVSQVADVVERWGDDMQAQLESAFAAQIAAAEQPVSLTLPPKQGALAGLPEAQAVAAQQTAQPADTSPAVNSMKAPARTPSKRDQRRNR
jgi:hypothetical protein